VGNLAKIVQNLGVMINMNDKKLDSPGAIRTFLAGADKCEFSVSKEQRYEWIAGTLKRTGYFLLRKKEKSVIREYLSRGSGYSRAQLTRLIQQYKSGRWIGKKSISKTTFPTRYTNEDILLLVKTDTMHQQLSGSATKKLFERAYHVYGDAAYIRLASISVAHIYNLRKSTFYQRQRRHFTKTQYTPTAIGERKKPNPNGKPGYIRIDTVHQGDQDKIKGVYHINAVDEVTQFQVVVSVERISENYLIPVLEQLLEAFPFKIINFHSDNGSEYINHTVARLLNKLNVAFTKSRARHSNDNALVETKNGSVVRKYLGYVHISQKWASVINEFNQNYLVPYLNYHRPCHFAEIIINAKGKEIKKYPYKNMMTPYEKLKSLESANQYLKNGISFEMLDQLAMSSTDLEAAEKLRQAQRKLFEIIFKKSTQQMPFVDS
jgi:transposase InsO family protein